MNRLVTIGVLALLGISGMLTAQDVTYNFDQSAEFSKFKSYKWVQIQEGSHPDQLIDQQIKSALDAELTKKGLSKTDGEKADLYVAYQLAIGQEKQINAYNTGGVGWGYGARWGGGMTTATTSTINIGMLVLDMYDTNGKQLVWRGKASKTIDANAKPDKRQKNLAKASQKLLKNYPPPVKK